MGRKCFRVLIFKSVCWVLSWRVSRCFKINSFLLFPVQILSFTCTCFSPCEGGHGAGHRRAEPGLCTTTCRHHAREHRLRGRHHTQATGHIGLLLLLREAAAYQCFFSSLPFGGAQIVFISIWLQSQKNINCHPNLKFPLDVYLCWCQTCIDKSK